MTNRELTSADPGTQMHEHKARLRAYFDGIGFERWSAIYGQGQLSSVRRSIREGHAAMMAQAEAWLRDYTFPTDAQALDAGCGTGLFSVRLAQRGFRVTAVDIAPQMIVAAAQQATQAGVRDRIRFVTGDLEAVDGSYDAVVCFDVLIHYPRRDFAQLCEGLVQRCRGPLLLTYAPHNALLATLHWLGGRFPKSQRRTDIQMIPDSFVRQTLESLHMRVGRSSRISKGFYHVKLLEARPAE